MAKAFASQGDMTEKKVTFDEVGEGLWAFTAEGDPNSGVIIGDDSVMIVEAQATPRLANKVIEKVREVTDKPISHVVLTRCACWGPLPMGHSRSSCPMLPARWSRNADRKIGTANSNAFPDCSRGMNQSPG